MYKSNYPYIILDYLYMLIEEEKKSITGRKMVSVFAAS